MKVINFGSLNIDYVYGVEHIVKPGETISADSFLKNAGGKGLNQSIALARAGADVVHAGCIGKDGEFLLEMLEKENINTKFVETDSEKPSGHAIIQLDCNGENSIVVYPGANGSITRELIAKALSSMKKNDILLIQNEIALIPQIMNYAHERGLRIFFNPSPASEALKKYPLELVDTLIVNATEAEILDEFIAKKCCNVLITRGVEGAAYIPADGGDFIAIPAVRAEHVVDTTGAGDTFCGFFIASMTMNMSIRESLERAARASAICVSRKGAAASIPYASEL